MSSNRIAVAMGRTRRNATVCSNRERLPETPSAFKLCRQCSKVLPATNEFWHSHRETKDKLNTSCKECARERARKWHAENREKANRRSLTYSSSHREEAKSKARIWRENNRTRYLHGSRKWRHENKERASEATKAWKAVNRERVLALVRNYKARKKAASGTHSGRDVLELLALQNHMCAACRCRIDGRKYHVDHIVPLSMGGSNDRGNLQILCAPCNLSKNARDPVEFMQSRGLLV